MEKIRKWMHSGTTEMEVDAAFGEVRSLGEPFATSKHLVALAVCLVISGQFYGWNVRFILISLFMTRN
jgi:hypothetical protein